MINNRPTFQKTSTGKMKYQQGLFIPNNPDKVIKLNNKGGLFYRSSWEKRLLIYFDVNTDIIKYGAEFMTIQYTLPKYENGVIKYSEHRYFPDFYYELQRKDGGVSKVMVEVKPLKETKEPILGEKYSHKQLKNFEYDMEMWNKNMHKWAAAIKFCESRGMEFVIVTEDFLNNLSKRYNI